MGYQVFYVEKDTLNGDVIFEDDYIQGNSNEIEMPWPIEGSVKKVAEESILDWE